MASEEACVQAVGDDCNLLVAESASAPVLLVAEKDRRPLPSSLFAALRLDVREPLLAMASITASAVSLQVRGR